jgi:hypothetical protein
MGQHDLLPMPPRQEEESHDTTDSARRIGLRQPIEGGEKLRRPQRRAGLPAYARRRCTAINHRMDRATRHDEALPLDVALLAPVHPHRQRTSQHHERLILRGMEMRGGKLTVRRRGRLDL